MNEFDFPDGHTAKAARGSAIAQLLKEAAADEYARAERGEPPVDPWTMSPTAHLLWADAIDIDDFPSPLYGFEVTGGIYMTEVLEPLIAAWPESPADLDRELDFLRAAAAYRGQSLSTIADDVRDLVSHWVRTKKILGIVAEIDPSVANFIVKPRWEDDRPS